MHRTTVFAIAILAGALFVVAAPAAADDVEECADAGAAEACVVDDRRGDPGNATEDCEGYRGFTGANASHSSDAGDYDATAGGEETCEPSWFSGERRNERVFADAEGEGPAGESDVLVQSQNRDFGPSDVNETTARVDHQQDRNRTFFRAEHEQFGDRCRLYSNAFADVAGYDYQVSVFGDCPEQAGPSAPPNPGWGDVTSLP